MWENWGAQISQKNPPACKPDVDRGNVFFQIDPRTEGVSCISSRPCAIASCLSILDAALSIRPRLSYPLLCTQSLAIFLPPPTSSFSGPRTPPPALSLPSTIIIHAFWLVFVVCYLYFPITVTLFVLFGLCHHLLFVFPILPHSPATAPSCHRGPLSYTLIFPNSNACRCRRRCCLFALPP